VKNYYKSYCKILSDVIKEASRLNYNSQTLNSNNKIKTTWKIVKSETGRKIIIEDVYLLEIEGNSMNNYQDIADAFYIYLHSVVEKNRYKQHPCQQ
jgi:hypothetical protein